MRITGLYHDCCHHVHGLAGKRGASRIVNYCEEQANKFLDSGTERRSDLERMVATLALVEFADKPSDVVEAVAAYVAERCYERKFCEAERI